MSVGTVTTIEHCAVKDGKAHTGTRHDIVNQVCKFNLDNRKLTVKVEGYPETSYHSYGNAFTDEEMLKDAVKFIYNMLPHFGYRLYRDIGF